MLLVTGLVISFIVVGYFLFKPARITSHLSSEWIKENGERTTKGAPAYLLGWYKIMESKNLRPGTIQKIKCFGEDLVAFRDDENKIIVIDSTCPHMGANLAYGKLDKGCIVCPFHGWKFNSNGLCTQIPYASKCERIPPQAKIRVWRTCEINHSIYIWQDGSSNYSVNNRKKNDQENIDEKYSKNFGDKEFDSKEVSDNEIESLMTESIPTTPTWNLPAMNTKLYSRCDGSAVYDITCHMADIADNSNDTQHFNFVHSPFIIKFLSRILGHVWNSTWEAGLGKESHIAQMKVETAFTFLNRPLKFTTLHIDILQVGPANVYMQMKTPIGSVLIVQSVLPVKSNLQKMSEVIYAPWWFPRPVSKLLLFGLSSQLSNDIAIWNTKKYLTRPLIVKSDGPILKFRRWMKQFHPKTEKRRIEIDDRYD